MLILSNKVRNTYRTTMTNIHYESDMILQKISYIFTELWHVYCTQLRVNLMDSNETQIYYLLIKLV